MLRFSLVILLLLVFLLLTGVLFPNSPPLPVVPYPDFSTSVNESQGHVLGFLGPPLLRFVDGEWRHLDPYFCISLLTAAFHNVPVELLGPMKRGWFDRANAKGAKVDVYRRQVAGIPDGDLVVFADLYDSFVLQNVTGILRAAAQLPIDDGVVFAAERNCFPKETDCAAVPKAPTSFRYANAGGTVARMGPNLRTFLKAWAQCAAAGIDDQLCVHLFHYDDPAARRYRPSRLPITLDHNCTLFQAAFHTALQRGPKFASFQRFEHGRPWVVDRSIVNPETGSRPAVLHFNGPKPLLRHYFYALFGNLTWHDPRVRNYQLRVWGRTVKGSELCAHSPS